MKALWNKPSHFFLPQTLLVLCCLALLLPAEAVAQQRLSRQFVDKTTGEINGRSPAQLARQGTPVAPIETIHSSQIDEHESDCDQDGGCADIQARQVEDVIVPYGVGDASQWINGRTVMNTVFQVQEGAPLNSMHIDRTGNLGLGTEAPEGRIHVVAKPGEEDARDIFVLDDNGNLELGGLLIEASSKLLKENFKPVDGQAVLETLAQLPITTWNYKTDDASVRHMGPMAQDFYAAFGLGADGEHIAPLDANGVLLVALQAVTARAQDQETHIATLEQQNAELVRRLEVLEALIRQLGQ